MIAILQTLDYVAIGVYMVIMAGMGLSLGYFVKDVADYFRGGSAIPWYVGGISNFMSLFSAFVFVAHAGIAYEDGLVAVTVIWCAVPATLIGAFVFAKIWRRAGISSPVEFLEERFSPAVRQLFSWGGLGFRVLDNMVRLYAIGVFLSAATPLGLDTSILLAGIVVVLYTVVGGLWAVVMTDVVQFVVLITATFLLVPLSYGAAGGWAGIEAARPGHLSFFGGSRGELLFLAVYYVMFAIKNNGNWAFIQRFYSVRDEAAGRKMGLLTAALFFIFPPLWLLPPLLAPAIIPGLDNPEMAYVGVALQLLPAGIMGIMLAAMFAATMSSLDSEYNVMASVVTKDIYQRIFRPDATPHELMRSARYATLLVGGLIITGALFVERFGGAFEASKLFTGLFAIPLVIPIVLGVLIPRATATGATASLLAGVATGLTFNALPQVSWEAATGLTIVVCTIIFLASVFLPQDRGARARVQRFFEQLRTPVAAAEKPNIEPDFQRMLLLLFVIALACVGALFVVMSAPSWEQGSGLMALAGGGGCLLLACLLYLLYRRLPRGVATQNLDL
ncbi:sodium:solute symporter family transporter [Neolewinella sp.]|uniref:sodium:solute symporter family transporter n=1 Tax=Neolewinella sp. TaxID=2993543 RepID=UPI003B524A8E